MFYCLLRSVYWIPCRRRSVLVGTVESPKSSFDSGMESEIGEWVLYHADANWSMSKVHHEFPIHLRYLSQRAKAVFEKVPRSWPTLLRRAVKFSNELSIGDSGPGLTILNIQLREIFLSMHLLNQTIYKYHSLRVAVMARSIMTLHPLRYLWIAHISRPRDRFLRVAWFFIDCTNDVNGDRWFPLPIHAFYILSIDNNLQGKLEHACI